MKNLIFTLTLNLLLIFFGQATFAQWSSDPAVNNAICTTAESQSDQKIISDGAGGAIITWDDQGNTSSADIYAQKINAAGVVQWALNGVAISTAAYEQDYPEIVSDGAGGAIITWFDFRSNDNYDIYAQKINAAGVVQWAVNGVAISTAANDQYPPVIVSDGAGGAIITWQDNRSGVPDVYAQKINAEGIVQWAANGIIISAAPSDQYYPAIVSDGEGGAVIAWQDDRNGSGSDIYAQLVNAAGAVQWAVNGVAISNAAGIQNLSTMASDGAGGAIITWYDNRYGGNSDIYAQRINAAGTVVWAVDGAVISAAAGNQAYPSIVADGTGGATITWDDNRNGTYNIYAQRIDASGAVQWAEDGVIISNAAQDQAFPTIVSDSADGAIITWADLRNGNANPDIYAQRINAAGTVQWTPNDVAISTAPNIQYIPVIITDGEGGAIITWYDNRQGSNTDIYAQNVNANGTLGCLIPSISAQTITQEVCENNTATDLTVTASGDGLTYQWYSDNNNQDFDGNPVSNQVYPSFTPPTTTAGTYYYYVVVTGKCGTATSAYATVTVDPLLTWYQDLDQDGYGNFSVTKMACTRPTGYVANNTDCNDANANVHPGAAEICNGIDDNCDGQVDEGVKTTFYRDADGDGYGDLSNSIQACSPPAGYVANSSDCNDNNAGVHSSQTYYKDNDHDGFGNPNSSITVCSSTAPAGYVLNNTDCDDTRATYADGDNDGYGAGPKTACGANNNTDCNDHDKNVHSSQTYYRDYDKDGYGDAGSSTCVCSSTPPSGYVIDHTDCNDRDKNIHSSQTYYKDYDKDGYGDPNSSTCVCSSTPPSGYVKDHTDCNDRDKNVHSPQTYYKDYDKDGYGDPNSSTSVCSSTPPSGYVKDHTDCNDRNKNIHPGAKEIAGNHIDDNCNGTVDEHPGTLSSEVNNDIAVDNEGKGLVSDQQVLKADVLPNPSYSYFTINVKGSSDKEVSVRIMDITGKVLEAKNKISPTGTLTIGHNYRPGIYFVEVSQGSERIMIKCVKL